MRKIFGTVGQDITDISENEMEKIIIDDCSNLNILLINKRIKNLKINNINLLSFGMNTDDGTVISEINTIDVCEIKNVKWMRSSFGNSCPELQTNYFELENIDNNDNDEMISFSKIKNEEQAKDNVEIHLKDAHIGILYLNDFTNIDTLYLNNTSLYEMYCNDVNKISTFIFSENITENMYNPEINLSEIELHTVVIDGPISEINIANSDIKNIINMNQDIEYYLENENTKELPATLYLNINKKLAEYSIIGIHYSGQQLKNINLERNIASYEMILDEEDGEEYFPGIPEIYIYNNEDNIYLEEIKLKNITICPGRSMFSQKATLENASIYGGLYTGELYLKNNISENMIVARNITVENNEVIKITGNNELEGRLCTIKNNLGLRDLEMGSYKVTTSEMNELLDNCISTETNKTKLERIVLSENNIDNIEKIDEFKAEKKFAENVDIAINSQYLSKIIEEEIKTNNYAVKIPQIIKAAKDKNSIAYTEKDYELTNCTLSEDGNSIILNASKAGICYASIKIEGGIAGETIFRVQYFIEPLIIGTIKQTPNELTNKDISLIIDTYSTKGLTEYKYLEGIKEISDFEIEGENITYSETDGIYSGTFTVTKNGIYTIYVKDAEGSEKIKQIEITNKVANIVYEKTEDGKVKAKLEFIDDGRTFEITNNNGQKEYIFNNNEAEFTFIIRDNNGNTGSITVILDNLSKEIVLEEKLYNEIKTQLTEKNINFNFDNEECKITITYNELKKITNLDLSNKELTSLEGIEYFSSLTNLNVSSNKIINLSERTRTFLNSLITLNLQNQIISKEITEEITEGTRIEENIPDIIKYYCINSTKENCEVGERIVLNTDNKGNNKIAKITVTEGASLGTVYTITYNVVRIVDIQAPNIIINYSTQETTTDKVTVIIIADEDISNVVTITENGETNEETWKYFIYANKKILIKQYDKNINQTVSVKDLAGNSSEEAEIKITWIEVLDKEGPTIISIEETPKTWTNGDVMLEITAEDESGLSDLPYSLDQTNWTNGEIIISENGSYLIYVKDSKGNITTGQKVITNIDKIKPKITIKEEQIEEGKYKTATVTIEETNDYEVDLKKDNKAIKFTNGMKIETIGSYEIKVTDIAGNVTSLSFEIAEYLTYGPYGTYEEDGKWYLINVSPETKKEKFIENLETNIEGITVKTKDSEELEKGKYVGTEMTVTIKEKEYIIIVKGDCREGNGISNMLDLLAVLYHKSYATNDEESEYRLKGANFKAGDIDKNGVIDMLDLLRILYHKERIEGFIL